MTSPAVGFGGGARAPTGFTLLELLVAMAIFGVVGALALGGLNTVLTQQSIAKVSIDDLQRLQRAIRIMQNDFTQIQPRLARDELGSAVELPLMADPAGTYLLRLTRGGWRNPAGLPRGTLQRVQYRFQDNKLIREYWPVMDRTLQTKLRSEVLLEGVDGVELQYLDDSNQWQIQWPPVGQNGVAPGPGLRPQAIKLVLSLKKWGKIARLFEVAR